MAVATLALLGTVISTALVGGTFWAAGQGARTPVPLAWALVFGALISPTDPVAVLATLKNVEVPEALEVEMQGERCSTTASASCCSRCSSPLLSGKVARRPSASGVATLLVHEAGGGVLARHRHRLRCLPRD